MTQIPYDDLPPAGEVKPVHAAQPARPATHWGTVAQFILSLLAVLGFWGIASLMGLLELAQSAGQPGGSAGADGPMLIAGLALCGLLLLPSAGYALARWAGRKAKPILPNPVVARGLMFFLLLVVLPAALLLGDWATRVGGSLSWVLPLANALAVSIPVLWFLRLGRYRLPDGSPQRNWGAFGAGMVIGSSIMVVLEVLAAIFLFLVAVIVIASQPAWVQALRELALRLETAPRSPEAILTLLEPYLQQPLVVFAAGAYLAVITPLIEEACKPIGLWFLARRSLTPADGFVVGMLSGAGFALLESLGYSAGSGADWTVIVVARSGTMLMHIFTSGLVGWGLAEAWNRRKYLRLAVAYLGAVLIHTLWNGLTVVAAALGSRASGNLADSPFFQLLTAALLAIGLLAGLIVMNAVLRRAIMAHSAPAPMTAAPQEITNHEETTDGKPD